MDRHPFYDANQRMLADSRTRSAGVAGMAAYLLFWAGAVALGMRELNRRFPVGRTGPDTAVSIARERFARGEIDREQYLALLAGLSEGAP